MSIVENEREAMRDVRGTAYSDTHNALRPFDNPARNRRLSNCKNRSENPWRLVSFRISACRVLRRSYPQVKNVKPPASVSFQAIEPLDKAKRHQRKDRHAAFVSAVKDLRELVHRSLRISSSDAKRIASGHFPTL